jgi:hypothetical protein
MAENEAAQKAGEAADAAKAAAKAQFGSMKANLGKATLGDYLSFKALITPVLIQVIFWIGILAIVISGLLAMIGGQFLGGLLMILLGPLLWRFYCELIIIGFKINDGVQTLVRQNGVSNTFD